VEVGGTPRFGCFIPGKDTWYSFQGRYWVPGPVWKGAENLSTSEIRFPDRPADGESLHFSD